MTVYTAVYTRKSLVHAKYSDSQLLLIIEQETARITNPCDVTVWMDLARTARQPQLFWEIDYIEPREILIDINKSIKRGESYIYSADNSIELKSGYTADINQQSAFNTIRAHLRADEGNFDAAICIYQSMLDSIYDDLLPIRQSNLLFHSCLAFLCTNKYSDSFKCFTDHWTLLKYMTPTDRDSLGIWDNQIILQMIYWHFLKHDESFRTYYCTQKNLQTYQIWNHKKIPLLFFMEYDNSWVVSFCGLSFYNQARTFMQLPEYEIKRSTPHNLHRSFCDDTMWQKRTGEQPVGWEKYYFEQYNQAINDHCISDDDRSRNLLYSYYQFQNNDIEDGENKTKLMRFLMKNYNIDQFSSILEAGCGISAIKTSKKYVGVDISEYVVHLLNRDGMNAVNMSINVYLEVNKCLFDLCFASDLLHTMDKKSLFVFLDLCSKRCQYLCVSVDTVEDKRSDILSDNLVEHYVEIHRIIANKEEWISYLQPYFNVEQSDECGSFLMFICKSRFYAA